MSRRKAGVTWKVDKGSVEKVEKLLKNGIREGTKKTRDQLIDLGQRNAKEIIVRKDAIWKTELYHSIQTSKNFSGNYAYKGQVFSNVEHAGPIEHGARYGARGPPVTALIPWVKSKRSRRSPLVGTSSPTFDQAPEDMDIAGPSSPGEILANRDISVVDSRFFEKGDWTPNDSFVGQDIILYDRNDGEYVQGVVTGYGIEGDPQVELEDGSTIEVLPYDVPVPKEYDPVYGTDANTLSDEEYEKIISQIYENNITIDESVGQDELEVLFGKSLDAVKSSIEDPELRQKFEKAVGKLPRVTDTPSKQTTAVGYMQPGAVGKANEIYINTQRDPKKVVNTGIHELHHLFNQYGAERGPATIVTKQGAGFKGHEHKSNPKKVPVNFDYYTLNSFEGHLGTSPTGDPGYADADEYFLGLDEAYRRRQLDHFGDSVFDDIENGTVKVDGRDYTPIDNIPETLTADGDIRVGDYLETESVEGTERYRIESILESDGIGHTEVVVADKSGERETIVVTDVSASIGSSEVQGLSFAPGDGPGRDIHPFGSNNPTDQYYEALNRLWLRAALASDKYDGDHIRRERFYPDGDNYALIGGFETSTNLWELVLDEDNPLDGEAADLYQNHPDVFYAVNKYFTPSDAFKEDVEREYGVPYEEILSRVTP